MRAEPCELYRMIPESELNRVFKGTASAELGMDFLGFEMPYKVASLVVPKRGWTILDLGCGYAAQAYFFTAYKKYIGVDLRGPESMLRFTTWNTEMYIMRIQDFVAKYLSELDLEHTFALCVAVPDKEAQDMIIREFPHHYVWYPGGINDLSFWNE